MVHVVSQVRWLRLRASALNPRTTRNAVEFEGPRAREILSMIGSLVRWGHVEWTASGQSQQLTGRTRWRKTPRVFSIAAACYWTARRVVRREPLPVSICDSTHSPCLQSAD